MCCTVNFSHKCATGGSEIYVLLGYRCWKRYIVLFSDYNNLLEDNFISFIHETQQLIIGKIRSMFYFSFLLVNAFRCNLSYLSLIVGCHLWQYSFGVFLPEGT